VIKIAGAVVLILGFAVSAQAQGVRAAGTASSPITSNSGGGSAGYGGGGFSIGPSSFRTLPHFPPAHFAVKAVEGNAGDYVPSTFVPYAKALAEGRALLAARPVSLGQFARENQVTVTPKAKIELVQDHHGYPVIRKL
jgi:hypothetical protein